jgi:predicted hotdog family 3-hydroxylacyl-ACP dehydratase
MQLDQSWIAAHIPHQGSMCLLERVVQWDTDSIHCQALSHQQDSNPLRTHGMLATACGIEYAAQAMAVHGALLSGAEHPPKSGFLASVRSVMLYAARLDQIYVPLDIYTQRLSGDADRVLYDFSLSADGSVLLTGRAAVVLNAGVLP